MRGSLFKCKYFLIYSPALASIASYCSSSPILGIQIWSIITHLLAQPKVFSCISLKQSGRVLTNAKIKELKFRIPDISALGTAETREGRESEWVRG